jgi:ribosome recycling factor
MSDIKKVLTDADDKMKATLAVLKERFGALRTGKASPAFVENVQVSYYGSMTRLRDMAGITAPEPRLIVITPYDPTALGDIAKAILAANLGVNPINDGRVIRVPIPELSGERRAELTKVAKREAEETRVAIRNIRRDTNEAVKVLQKDGKITEDERDRSLDTVQKNTDAAIAKVDAEFKAKETEVMAV